MNDQMTPAMTPLELLQTLFPLRDWVQRPSGLCLDTPLGTYTYAGNGMVLGPRGWEARVLSLPEAQSEARTHFYATLEQDVDAPALAAWCQLHASAKALAEKARQIAQDFETPSSDALADLLTLTSTLEAKLENLAKLDR